MKTLKEFMDWVNNHVSNDEEIRILCRKDDGLYELDDYYLYEVSNGHKYIRLQFTKDKIDCPDNFIII